MHKSATFFLFLSLFLISFSASAQEIQVDTSSTVDIRLPGNDVIEAYANDSDFIYQGVAENPNSLSQRIFSFLINTLFRILNNPLGEFFVYLILIASVIGLVLALINQLMGGELVTLFSKDKNKGFSLGIEKEELIKTDYEELLKQALQQNDYHAATRFVYLISLQKLAKRGLITWSLEKTNLDFIRELTGHPIKEDFVSLTNTYEYVEYGDFEINATQFNRYQSMYDRINSTLNE
ncbi:MAG: DUF4129 domain-containing protein [Balneolaceae bacterium]|nr:DUF4129 domain-containing protein [Balneolaceae bacterium]